MSFRKDPILSSMSRGIMYNVYCFNLNRNPYFYKIEYIIEYMEHEMLKQK